jgi:sulfur carrier protein ThiS
MVEITLHPLLAKRAASRQETRTVAFQSGLTPKAVLLDEGFSEVDAEAVMVLRNDVQIDPETPLNDGDRVEFMVGIQGGNGMRETRLPLAGNRRATKEGTRACSLRDAQG